MADASATFEINLQDGTSGAAEHASNALARLRRSIDADTKALAEMQRAMKNLQGGTVVNVEQFRQLKAQIDEKKASIAQAQSAFISLGGAFNKTRPPTDKFKEFLRVSQSMPGPLGGIVGSFGKLKELLAGSAMTIALIGIAAGFTALVVAAGLATAALLKYGIAQANATRAELLRLEAMTKMRSLWGFAAGSASELQNAIDRISDSTSLGRDKVAEYGMQLYRMGLRGENLSEALEGAAIKGAVLGDEAARGFMGWAAGANMAGRSVKRLTDDVRARFGAVAAKLMLDLDVQAKKLRENFSKLFGGLRIEGFLSALSSVTQLFSQNTATGRALKAIMATVFQPMVDAIASTGPVAKRFFQGMVIAGLMFGIVVLRIRKWFRDSFGSSEALKGLDMTKAALYAGVAAAVLLGVAFVAAGIALVGAVIFALPFIWSMVAGLAAMALNAIIIAAPFILGAIAIGALIAAGYQLYRLWKEIDWKSLGKSIVDGIVNGLKNGARWVIDTVRGLGTSVMNAFKEKLGISSPSQVFAQLGVAIPEGVEKGIAAGAPAADEAAAGMVGVPAGGRAGGGAVSVTIGDVHLHSSAENGAELAADFRRELERLLSGIAIQLGAPVAGGVA